jgi:hypothetical protein
MSRAPSTFKRRDVTAAVKAVVKAGVEVAKVEIGADGKIIVVAERPSSERERCNPWDEVLDHADRP